MLNAVLHELLTLKFLLLYAYVACVAVMHFRGKERLRFGRQLTEHSGLVSPYNVLMYLFSAVPRRPLLDVRDFPQLAPLRENWETIRDEAQALHAAGHIGYRDRSSDLAFVSFYKRGWKRFYLKWYDDFMPSAVELCPKTVELVRSIPDVNAAAFTLLPPGGELGRHRDPLAASLRYHLGLVTPGDERCRIWVDGQEYVWKDGEDVVFDETYIHWAENRSDTPRIILFADVTRPLHTPVVRAINQFFIRYLARATKSRNLESEKVGLLNRFTPLVYRLKYVFIGLKQKNRPLYYAGKYALVLGLAYLLLGRHLLP